MGIVNVTPDSFSDGGRYLAADAAVAHGRTLLAQGADLLDIGGESTRPGAQRPDEAEELRRVIPVIRALAQAGAVVSVDTMRAQVAAEALAAGARIVNDVSGGLADPEILQVAAGRPDTTYVVMHWRAHGAVMNDYAAYDDVVADVCAELAARVAAARQAGIAPDRLVLDPGLGFSKEAEHNWALLAALPRLAELGHPLLIGASRKRFLGALLAGPDGTPADPAARDAATAAVSALVASQGVWAVRVHDVAASVAAVAVAAALTDAAGRAGSNGVAR
ncbi:MAG: dihydropteroate synthase [Actinobacteria bacterium]|nr:dihydropteroate synthase [Actinomycetota bacterium]